MKYRGQLKGKIVLTQPARQVRMLEYGDGTVLRYADKNGKWLGEAMTMPPARAGGAGRGGGGRGAGGGAGNAAPTPPADPCAAIGAAATAAAGRAAGAAANPDDPAAPAAGGGGRGGGLQNLITQFYKSEGVLALFDRGSDSDMAAGGSDLTWQQQHPDGGTFAVQSGGRQGDPPGTALPQVTLAVEHYNRMVRLLDHNVPVKVELNIQTKVRAEAAATPNGFNIVGEIPGTDKADEIVAHRRALRFVAGRDGRDRQRRRIGRDDGSAAHSQSDGPRAAADDSHRAVGRRGGRAARIARVRAARISARRRRRCPSWRRRRPTSTSTTAPARFAASGCRATPASSRSSRRGARR